jgi:hypothetical protein
VVLQTACICSSIGEASWTSGSDELNQSTEAQRMAKTARHRPSPASLQRQGGAGGIEYRRDPGGRRLALAMLWKVDGANSLIEQHEMALQ